VFTKSFIMEYAGGREDKIAYIQPDCYDCGEQEISAEQRNRIRISGMVCGSFGNAMVYDGYGNVLSDHNRITVCFNI